MFHLFSFGKATDKTKGFIVGTNHTPNPLPQQRTRSPWPYNRMKIGDCIWFNTAETRRDSRVAAIDAALMVNRKYKKDLSGDMLHIFCEPGYMEITRIR